MLDDEDRLYTVQQVMDRTNLGQTKVYELIRTGELASVKVGKSRRVPASALRLWMAGLMRKANENEGRQVA